MPLQRVVSWISSFFTTSSESLPDLEAGPQDLGQSPSTQRPDILTPQGRLFRLDNGILTEVLRKVSVEPVSSS